MTMLICPNYIPTSQDKNKQTVSNREYACACGRHCDNQPFSPSPSMYPPEKTKNKRKQDNTNKKEWGYGIWPSTPNMLVEWYQNSEGQQARKLKLSQRKAKRPPRNIPALSKADMPAQPPPPPPPPPKASKQTPSRSSSDYPSSSSWKWHSCAARGSRAQSPRRGASCAPPRPRAGSTGCPAAASP